MNKISFLKSTWPVFCWIFQFIYITLVFWIVAILSLRKLMLCDGVIFWGSFFSSQWWKSPPTYQHCFGERRWWIALAVLFCAKAASSAETCLAYSCQACCFVCHDRLVDCEVFACLHSHCAHERHLLKPLGAKVGRLCQSLWELC